MRAADNLGSSQGIHGGILENCFLRFVVRVCKKSYVETQGFGSSLGVYLKLQITPLNEFMGITCKAVGNLNPKP